MYAALPRTLTAVSVHLQHAQPTATLTFMALHLWHTQQTVGCSMQQCQVSAYLDIIQVVNVELGDGSAPNCDINGLGGRGIGLHQHHSQILVHLQMHTPPHTCAFKPGCLTSRNWRHTPDCKVLVEMKTHMKLIPDAYDTTLLAGLQKFNCWKCGVNDPQN